MPIHLTNPDRRNFLQTTLGAGVSLLTFRSALADDVETSEEPEHVALLSDPHIAEDARQSARGYHMAANLLKVVADILTQSQKPTMALINGDCAYLDGQPGDYRTLASLVGGLSKADIPLHMAMGNHDNRTVFAEQLKQLATQATAVEGRHVSLIQTKYANWFLLDTLQKVNQVTGEVGLVQLEWLKSALASRDEKPTIVVGHHNLQFTAAEDKPITGLQDSQELIDVLESHSHVTAYIYGHTHQWNVTRRDSGLHLINLPAIGYPFAESAAVGWVDAGLSRAGVQLTLHSVDPSHKQHLASKQLSW